MIALGLLLAGVPEDVAGEDLEGPTIVLLEKSRGVDATNVAALILLAAGVAGLLWGAIRHPDALMATTAGHPVASILLTLQLGAGIGLLLLSGVSTTVVLWASGTFLSVTALAGLAALLRQGVP